MKYLLRNGTTTMSSKLPSSTNSPKVSLLAISHLTKSSFLANDTVRPDESVAESMHKMA